MSYKKAVAGKYFALNPHQRINLKSWRNALNINWLFSTVLNDVNMRAIDPMNTERPRPQLGIYHHQGKRHSMYPRRDGSNY